MVGTLILLLTNLRPDVITNTTESIMALICLALVPMLAYPISAIIPAFRQKGRDGQRNLAIILSAIGYTGGVVYGFVASANASLMLIFGTYFVSVVGLIILNKCFKIKASGHACSIAGPIGLVCYFLPVIFIPVSLLLYAVIFWASVYMGRHTAKEFICGSLVSPISLGILTVVMMLL